MGEFIAAFLGGMVGAAIVIGVLAWFGRSHVAHEFKDRVSMAPWHTSGPLTDLARSHAERGTTTMSSMADTTSYRWDVDPDEFNDDPPPAPVFFDPDMPIHDATDPIIPIDEFNDDDLAAWAGGDEAPDPLPWDDPTSDPMRDLQAALAAEFNTPPVPAYMEDTYDDDTADEFKGTPYDTPLQAVPDEFNTPPIESRLVGTPIVGLPTDGPYDPADMEDLPLPAYTAPPTPTPPAGRPAHTTPPAWDTPTGTYDPPPVASDTPTRDATPTIDTPRQAIADALRHRP